MGKGGRSSDANAASQQQGAAVTDKQQPLKGVSSNDGGVWQSPYNPLDPNTPPLPTKGQIKASIPSQCFERSALRGFYFIGRDTIMSAALIYVTSHLLTTDIPTNFVSFEAFVWFMGWNMYAFWQGTILTGHWVLGHECGHGAFSDSQTFNDIVGFVLHQSLLVPYFAWQYTHAKHHRRTNNLVDGESHVPSTAIENGVNVDKGEKESSYSALHEAMGDGAFAAFEVFAHLVIGWPLYLLGMASTGRLAADGTFLEEGTIIDHFRPWSKMFPSKIRSKIVLSTTTLLLTLGVLFQLSVTYGFTTVFLWYGFPYMWTNSWLVLYTWLQHTDASVPQYGADEWTWVKGALATIDRPYGIFDFFHHRIGSTHVAHHLFHEMPFYNADLATAALKEYLEPKGLYNYNPQPFYKEMWRVAHECHYVQDITGVQYFKSFDDLPSSSSASAASASGGKKEKSQ